jgi:signal transduction histidine kinase/DNA-binding NarL/FixJ family response regulator
MDIINQIIEQNQSILVTIAEIAVFSVFISLILYHFVIYAGRRNSPEGSLYLYMTLLLSGLLLYIFLDTNMYYIIVSLVLDTNKWTSFFTAVSWLIIFRSIQQLLNNAINPPERVSKITGNALIVYLISLILWLTPVLPSLTGYHRQIFIIFWVFNGVFIGLYSVTYLYTLYSGHNKTETGIRIITVTALCYILYIWFYRLAITIYPVHLLLPFWLINNILKIGVAFTFAFSLAVRFNSEFADLIILKEDLQRKVEEKTSELQLANKKIEESSKIKTDYFINVAHETKTPLTLIGNYLDRYIIRNGESDELKIISSNFDLLRDTMVRFLDTEKFEKDEEFYNHDQLVSATRLINIKIPLYRELSRKKNINFISETEENILLKADQMAIERILNNLFDNALKFSAEFDTISLTLRKVNNFAVITVSDSGPGIDSKSVPAIFQPYFQLDNREKNLAGLGMGLYIVKRIVDSLNGEIKVEENPGGGTIFSIMLPAFSDAENISPVSGINIQAGLHVTETATGVPAVQHTPAGIMPLDGTKSVSDMPEYSPARKNILVIEDNKDMLRYLQEELSAEYNVFTAINGINALSLLKTSPRQDLILSDVMMDSMDGFEFFDLIRLDSKYNTIPFLFITARSDQQEKIKMLNRGVADYLYKPFSVDELKARICSSLKNAESQRKSGINDAIETLNLKLVNKTGNTSNDKWEVFSLKVRDYSLTRRQIEIITEVEKGSEYKQIADKLNISPKTVHRHMQILFEKFNVHSKIELLKALFE